MNTRFGLALGALGVVFGDIGTSPLYALHDGFSTTHHPIPVSPENVLGLLSLVFWALIVVVSLKYVMLVMRADNRGEGGIVAMMALALRKREGDQRMRRNIMWAGIFGAALFYGDGVITPAISVISAIEGLEVGTSEFKPYVVPITLVVLTALFALQRVGTDRIGALFGPVMVVWFVTLGVLGFLNVAANPSVLVALNPVHAAAFLLRDPATGFFSLGTVVLVLTGVEALYADMGHFGRVPIRLAWYGLVLPTLVLCYFGQGALILHDPATIANPFYLLGPSWSLYPLVILSTVATVIASQAVISGAYSMTQQAMQLGYAPRMNIQHTSQEHRGQIYIEGINWALYVTVVGLVLGFQSSANLAAAFGIAVSGTMLITTFLVYIVIHDSWGWPTWRALAVVVPLGLIDVGFFLSNAAKFADGGWFPIAFGVVIFILMGTWKRGRMLLHRRTTEDGIALKPFIDGFGSGAATRVPGTAVFLTNHVDQVPRPLLHILKHFRVLHEVVVLVNVRVRDVPHVEPDLSITIDPLGGNFWRLSLAYGFMDKINVPEALARCGPLGLEFDPMTTSYFLDREKIVPRVGGAMNLWRERLFVVMYQNSVSVTDFFHLPNNAVVELGSQICL
jgi:KUP system potassium uptake protein